MWRYKKYSYKVIVYVHSPYEHARSQCPSVAYTFSIPALSMSKCRYLQSLLQCAKANALRLNELLHAELLSMAALTPAQLVINQATARYPQTANLHSGELAGGENRTNQNRIACLISGIFCDVSRTSQIRLRLSGWI